MISKTLQIALLLAIFVYFIVLIYFLKKKKIELKYTILWIFSGLLMLILTIFPQILAFCARIVAIDVPANALFSVVIFCIIIITMSLTTIVSKMNDNIKNLTQAIALLEKRIRELENKNQ